jgi:hypothetical protein
MIPILPSPPTPGAPCNGCGRCCAEEVCSIGRMAYHTDVAPCPGLKIRGNIARCELVEAEDRFHPSPILRGALGIGMGCDALFPVEGSKT